VNRDAARDIAEVSRAVFFSLHFHRQIGILDYHQLTVLGTEVSELFFWIRLRNHLARHLRASVQMPADKRWVNAPHQRIIHLEIAQRIDAFALHQIQGTATLQSTQRTAVSIR
jgi:hypothetical protein